MNIKYTILFLSICINLLFSSTTTAWNAVGHMLVAKIAYDHLKPSVRIQVDKMVADLAKEYPDVTDFEQMAVWPDKLRYQRINLYTHWHYIDVAFSEDKSPLKNLTDTDNALWAVTNIKTFLKNEHGNHFERARSLAFLIHVGADLHQPLHTVSRISAVHPNGDEGGNLHLINYKIGSVIIKNLHQLWDNGLGKFQFNSDPATIHQYAKLLTSQYSEAYFGSEARNTYVEDWMREGLTLAISNTYRINENETPSVNYIQINQQIAEQRVVLAGYRLAEMLNDVLS